MMPEAPRSGFDPLDENDDWNEDINVDVFNQHYDGSPRKDSVRISKKNLIILLSVVIVAILVLLMAVLFLAILQTGSASSDDALRKAELQFLEYAVNNDTLSAYSRYYTSKAHVAGTDADYEQAMETKANFERAGFQTEVKEYWVYLSYAGARSVQLVGPGPALYTAVLEEKALPQDPDSADPTVVPSFVAYSGGGNVTAELVYVNYGRDEDFAWLVSHNVTLRGKVGIARYGKIFRGLKVELAERHGLVGMLIYSDPADDGFAQGPEYPDGPYRPPHAVQRGSLMYISRWSGDPLTPGKPALKDADRLDPKDANLPKIPVQPLSWKDAQPFLMALEGQKAPESFVGGLKDITYHVGPGPALVNIHIEQNNTVTKIWNVVATLAGEEEDEEGGMDTVVVACHRDAWVFGAADPVSGHSVLMGLAESLGKMKAAGWTPRRRLVMASWDAEEYGLLGSTEYVEDNAAMLNKRVVAYLNMDVAVAGDTFTARASPHLAGAIRLATSRVPSPHTSSNASVFDVWSKDLATVDWLGSGSDYTPFLQHLGISSTDVGFTGRYGVYHSIFDSYHWMEAFGDPHFKAHEAVLHIMGILTIDMLDSVVLPFQVQEYGLALQKALGLTKSAMDSLILDHPDAAQKLSDAMDTLYRSIDKFADAASAVSALTLRAARGLLSADQVRSLNRVIAGLERQFIVPEGLYNRPWFKNIVVAPGLHTGYAPEVFPSLRESMREGSIDTVLQQAKRLAEVILQAADWMMEAAK